MAERERKKAWICEPASDDRIILLGMMNGILLNYEASFPELKREGPLTPARMVELLAAFNVVYLQSLVDLKDGTDFSQYQLAFAAYEKALVDVHEQILEVAAARNNKQKGTS
ncbi:MAG: hypothetical protein IOB84_01585 [Brevundimonas sp.]|nr:hypothetical protein [Brevundimonas sp.]